MTAANDPVREARDALRRVQTGRVWYEPYSDALNPIIEAIKALDVLAGHDNVRKAKQSV